MMHKGSRIENADYFDDILGDNNPNAVGVFQGMGMTDFENIKQKIGPEGVILNMNCRHCNWPTVVTVEWEELYYIGLNGPGKPLVLPRGWVRSDQNMDCYVQLQCGRCHNAGLNPHFSPDEARQLVNQAVQSGFITKQTAQAWQQKAAMYARAAG